jgi:hypothetical protein
LTLQRVENMRSQKVTIYIRLCGEPGRPFERLRVRNPRQCRERDHYCLRVAGKWEFFPEGDPARKDLNEALHRQSEREHELRIGVAAPLIPQPKAEAPSAGDGDTTVRHAITTYIDALYAENNNVPKTIQGKKFGSSSWSGGQTNARRSGLRT